MQIIIENEDIKNMDSKILADMLIMIANGSTTPAENDLLTKEVAATETEAKAKAKAKADVATVPAEEVAEVKAEAEDIIKVEEPAPAEETKPTTKKNTRKSKKAETPAPVEEAKKEEPAPEAKTEADDDEPAPEAKTEADDDEPDFDDIDNIEDSEPAPKRTKAEMKKAITSFCNADPNNVKKLKEIASEMGYEKVKDMSEEDMARMLEKAGV